MITKNYIKMCGKAKEIQKLQPSRMWHTLSARPDDGLDDNDYLYASPYYLPKEKGIRILKWDNDEGHPIIGGYSDSERGAIWLPTQEQLQGMLFTKSDFYDNLIEFTNFVDNEYCYFAEKNDNYKTFNELWLAFVMKEKYNKTWNGKDWVKEGK